MTQLIKTLVKRVNPPRKGVLTIAASDTPSPLRDFADYTCDGTADDVQIQAAITKLAGAGIGGTVLLLAGNYTLAAAIDFDGGSTHDAIALIGEGMERTIITFAPGTSLPVIKLYVDATETLDDITIADMSLVLNGSSAATGISIELDAVGASINNTKIERVKITSSTNAVDGITVTTGTGTIDTLHVRDCDIQLSGNNCYGILTKKADSVWVVGNYIDLSNAASYNAIAIYGDTTNFHVVNNTVKTSNHSCIAISSGQYGEITSNIIIGSPDENDPELEAGIEVEWKAGHGGVTVSHDVIVANNVVKGQSGALEGGGILVTDRADDGSTPYNITITGNVITDTAEQGILVTHGNNIIIQGNVVRNCGILAAGLGGIESNALLNVVIANNSCRDNGKDGIVVAHRSGDSNLISNYSITGNVTFHNGTKHSYGSGIYINSSNGIGGDMENVVVANNICTDVAPKTQRYGLRFEDDPSETMTRVIVSGNVAWDAITPPYIQDNSTEIKPLRIGNIGSEDVDYGTLVVLYDFAIHGGATGSIGLGQSLPENAIVIESWYEVLTTFASPTGPDNATIGLGITTDDATGIKASIAINDGTNPWDAGNHDGIQDGTAANFSTKTTAKRELILTIGGENITAGKLVLACKYIVTG